MSLRPSLIRLCSEFRHAELRSVSLNSAREANQDTYLVLEDFGSRLGRARREADENIDRKTLIRDLMEEQYGLPVRIVAFNTTEGWSRDVTMDIADELRRRFSEYAEVPTSVQQFLETASRAR